MCQAEGLGVGSRDGERIGGKIGRNHLPLWSLACERKRDRARAGAEIGDAGLAAWMKRQRPLYQQLRLRPRNQHGRTHGEVDRPKLLVTQNVGHGLTGSAALEKIAKARSGIGCRDPLRVGAQSSPAGAERMGEQQLGIESRHGVRITPGCRRRQTLRTNREQRSDRPVAVLDSRRSHHEAKMPSCRMPYIRLKPRSFGELLDAVLQIFRLSLLKCLPYATIAIIAGQLSTLYYLSRGRTPVLDSND